MTAHHISNGLYWMLSRQSYQIQIPNYTPIRWWESDHYAVTKAGFGVEFEIKLSVSDFKIDRLKQRDTRVMKDGWDIVRDDQGKMLFHQGEKKHDQLAARDTNGPSRFYFVVPDGMIPAQDIPEWAGLLYARENTHGDFPRFTEIKQAPKLHRTKVGQDVLDNIRNAFFYRYWTLRGKMKTLPEIAPYDPPEVGSITESEDGDLLNKHLPSK